MFAIRRNLKRIGFWRVTGATRPLPIRDSTVDYLSPSIYEQETVCDGLPALNIHDEETVKSAAWLNEEKSAYWLNSTEPMKPEKQPGEIWYRSCNCWLAVEWCICHE